jgi:hypothetical protein
VRQQVGFDQAAALHERQSAVCAQSSGGVGKASPDGFELDMVRAAEKDRGILMLERGESAAQGVLGPALRIGLGWILKRPVERDEQLGNQLRQIKTANQVRRFADYEVVSIRQRLAERFYAGFWRKLAKRIEGGKGSSNLRLPAMMAV